MWKVTIDWPTGWATEYSFRHVEIGWINQVAYLMGTQDELPEFDDLCWTVITANKLSATMICLNQAGAVTVKYNEG